MASTSERKQNKVKKSNKENERKGTKIGVNSEESSVEALDRLRFCSIFPV